MSAQWLSQFVGKYALLRSEQLRHGVEILDARESFGRTDCLVRPFPSGEGQQWVSVDRLKIEG